MVVRLVRLQFNNIHDFTHNMLVAVIVLNSIYTLKIDKSANKIGDQRL
jgi:hypothetical protein